MIGLVVLTLFSCGPTIYKITDFDARKANHKTVAILPADVTISLRPNEMKKTTPEALREMEKSTAYTFQDKMYTWFLKRNAKKPFSVTFEDVSKTNALIAKAGITYEDLRIKSKEEIAKLLGVDAVITTKVSMQKPMSEGAAVALGLLIGVWGTTNNVQTSISIHDASDGNLIWKYDYTASGSVGNSTDNLVNALMRNASKKFPYN